MRKLSPAAFLISGTLVFGNLLAGTVLTSTPAFAEDDETSISPVQEVEQDEGLEHSPRDKKHEEIEQKFGKQGRLAFPPMVIRPIQEDSVGVAFIAVNPALKGAATGGVIGSAVYPERNVPIDISNVKFTRKTPADVFIQASQVGLYVMAAGALALSAIAASRAIRRK
jgi:hypothetical protein